MRLRVFLLLAVASCATLRNDATVCAEYRELRCAAGTSCSMDQARGCKVCQCAKAFSDPANPDPPQK